MPGEGLLILSLTEYRLRKYKKYADDSSVPVPKSTMYDRVKRAKLSTSIPPSLYIPEPQSAVAFGYDRLQEMQSSGELSEQMPVPVDEFVLSDEMEVGQFEDLDDDQDSIISSASDVSVYSDSSTDAESSDSADDNETANSQQKTEKTFSAQETACMAILALISRHCVTTEAAKDIIDLLKVLCPENETLKSLTYANVQQVCGNCELFVFDVCEKCLCLFPTELQDQVTCSTPGCDG